MSSPPSISPLAEVPPAALAVIGFLQRSEQYLARHAGDRDRIGPRKPAELGDGLWTVVRSAGAFSLAPAHGAWAPLVQVEVCAAGPVAGVLPEFATQQVAALAAGLLHGARAEVFRGSSWKARHIDGPNDLTDSRGGAAVVWRHVVRFDVRQHART